MTTATLPQGAPPAPAGKAGLTRPDAWVVRAHDVIDRRIAGHEGVAYTSPPQPRATALALVALLVGPIAAHAERDHWTLPVAGGRRIVALEPAP